MLNAGSDIYTHMKTTIDIADSLMNEAKRLAAKEGTTLRALVEEGLRRLLGERKASRGFRLRDVAFGGTGLEPDLREAPWEEIRQRAYEGRGE